jgi:citronellol/citronellal dehydrogenase
MRRTLEGRTILMSGGSRGIGLAIALRAARDGANVAMLAKTAQPDPRLPGTIHTACEAVAHAGGRALAVVGDVRNEADIERAVAQTVAAFGAIDICINNASAIDLSPTATLAVKRFDLMQAVNARGTFLLSQACLPHLARAADAHILTISPPLNLNPRWLGDHLGYTLSKYGMSLCTLGLADELRPLGIAANSLWPRTLIATAAVRSLGADEALARARRPEIMADAAHAVLTRPAADCTGELLVDEDVLREEGVEDFEGYRAGTGEPALDLFLDDDHAISRWSGLSSSSRSQPR